MKITLAIVARSIALAAAFTAPAAPLVAQEPEIVVGASLARQEIERILEADNVDLDALGPREVAEAMASIPRGRAPQDFWDRYQGHLRAWQWYAAVASTEGVSGHDVLEAEDMVNATFANVEKVALSYGAHLPDPHTSR